jgi:YidC/Oxa1 family membrane protein insertase
MSNRPQPTKKQMFMQQLMLIAFVFLATQLYLNRPQPAPDPRTPEQVLGSVEEPASGTPPALRPNEDYDISKATMMWAAASLNWSTLSQIKGVYQKKLDEQAAALKKGVKDPGAIRAIDEEIREKQFYADLLAADAAYRFALTRNDTNVMRQSAYGVLAGWERKLQGSPLWAKKFPVPAALRAPSRFPWATSITSPAGGTPIASSAMKLDQLVEGKWVSDTPAVYRIPNQQNVVAQTSPGQISGQELTDRLVAEIAARNQSELTWGIFPGYKIIDALVGLTGRNPGFSYAFAAFLLALLVRIAVFPLVQKQLMWGRKMQQLGPLVKEIREQYTDKKTKQVTNPQELQQKTMALYAEYGINPLAGCLPAGIQFPLFITVYQFMLHYQFAFQQGTFLWINPQMSRATNGFLAPTLGHRDYILIILYGITMIFSTLLMPVSDPNQIKQQKLMGIGFGLFFTVLMFTGVFPTPAAFVLYWVFTNLLATAQSLRAYRMPIPPLEKVNTKAGGVFPMPPFQDAKTNGRANGKSTQPIQMPKSTGTPAKHKPKKRK